MGWCINCHRETEVKTEGNDYYDKLVKLHNANTNEPMKVNRYWRTGVLKMSLLILKRIFLLYI